MWNIAAVDVVKKYFRNRKLESKNSRINIISKLYFCRLFYFDENLILRKKLSGEVLICGRKNGRNPFSGQPGLLLWFGCLLTLLLCLSVVQELDFIQVQIGLKRLPCLKLRLYRIWIAPLTLVLFLVKTRTMQIFIYNNHFLLKGKAPQNSMNILVKS